MTVRNRNILGEPNPLDDGRRANYVEGREPKAVGRTDQSSPETQADRDTLTAAYRQSQAAASTTADDNTAAGMRLSPDGHETFTTK